MGTDCFCLRTVNHLSGKAPNHEDRDTRKGSSDQDTEAFNDGNFKNKAYYAVNELISRLI